MVIIDKIIIRARTLKAGWTIEEYDESPNFKLVESYETDYEPSDRHHVIDVEHMVADWIEEQSVDQWRHIIRDSGMSWGYYRYIVSEELLTLLILTWSWK